MRPRGEPGIDDDRRSDSMRQNREDINNRSPNPTILEQDRLDTKENQRPRTWPKSLARKQAEAGGRSLCATVGSILETLGGFSEQPDFGGSVRGGR